MAIRELDLVVRMQRRPLERDARGAVETINRQFRNATRTGQDFTRTIRQDSRRAFNRLEDSAERSLEGTRRELRRTQSAATRMNAAIAGGARSAIGPLVALAGGVLGVHAAISAVRSAGRLGFTAIGEAAERQATVTQFRILLRDAQAAAQLSQDIIRLSTATPLEPRELTDAARSLLAFGVSQDDVIRRLRQLGDVSQAVGAPIGDIAEIFGKARVQGRLFAEDINQLTGRGIPVIAELAAQFGVAESEVRGLVESGQVGFENLALAIDSLTGPGGRFAGIMEALSTETSGLISTLRGNLTEALVAIGDQLIQTFDVNQLLTDASTFVRAFVAEVNELDLSEMQSAFQDMFSQPVEDIKTIVERLEAAFKIARTIAPILGGTPGLEFGNFTTPGPGGLRGIVPQPEETSATVGKSIGDFLNRVSRRAEDIEAQDEIDDLRRQLDEAGQATNRLGDVMIRVVEDVNRRLANPLDQETATNFGPGIGFGFSSPAALAELVSRSMQAQEAGQRIGEQFAFQQHQSRMEEIQRQALERNVAVQRGSAEEFKILQGAQSEESRDRREMIRQMTRAADAAEKTAEREGDTIQEVGIRN